MSVLLKPPAIGPGDAIGIVAPASPFDRGEFDRGVTELCAMGFVPEWTDDVFARERYVAGDARTRAHDLSRAWKNPRVKALFGVRGGYGSVQIIPSLDPGTVRGAPKAFVGYSDLTTLLTWLVVHCGIVAFHGPTVAGRLADGEGRYDRASLLSALTVAEPMGEVPLESAEVIVEGEARGRLLGGTLTQIAAAAGTPYALMPWDDTILLLEDVGERPYRLDRLLQQVRDAGIMRRVKGVVLGYFPAVRRAGRRVDGARGAGVDVRRVSWPGCRRRPDGARRGAGADVALGRAVHAGRARHSQAGHGRSSSGASPIGRRQTMTR